LADLRQTQLACSLGPRRVKKSGGQTHPWRAREGEPIMGGLGRSPQRRSRGQSPGSGSGKQNAPWSRGGFFCV